MTSTRGRQYVRSEQQSQRACPTLRETGASRACSESPTTSGIARASASRICPTGARAKM